MGDMMTFPASVEEFMEQYKMTDTEHVYSNGTEYVPIYRMKQWFEHVNPCDFQPVRHGRWILQANNERTNYRWNVTAECSECCDEKKEIWAGFFPNVPDWLARDVALESAKSVKLSNYCPNCGAKMDGELNE